MRWDALRGRHVGQGYRAPRGARLREILWQGPTYPVKSLPCPAIVCLAANLAPAPCTCTLPRLHCNALYLAWAPVHALLDGGRKLIVCCLCRQ